jgi:hypothetical protein
MNDSAMTVAYHPTPWNQGKLIGQKPPLKLREIWALRTRLEMARKTKELACSTSRSTASSGAAIWCSCG